MFRITEDPSSGSLVQCLARNYKKKLEEYAAITPTLSTTYVNGHDRTITVIFSQEYSECGHHGVLRNQIL